MKNKRNFIAFILLLLPLLVAVGMSTWIILNESLLTPSYNPDRVIKKYFSGEESIIYDGNEHAPVSSVENLIEFGDLEFSYKPILDTTNNYISGKPKNAGVYDVKVSVKNLDNSSTNVKFIITPKPISIEVYGETEFTFNKSKQAPSLRVVEGLIGDDECMLYVDDDYDSVDAGDYVLTKNNIKLSNSNYTLDGNPSFNYVIKQKNISDSNVIFEDLTNCNYDGSIHEPVVKAKVKFNSNYYVLTANVDYTVDYADNVNEGTAKVTVTGKGNYKGTKVLTFEIEPGLINLEKTTISGISDLTYSGTPQTQNITVSIENNQLIVGEHFEIEYSNNINAGVATITLKPIAGISENTNSENFKILPLKINVKNKIVSIDYVSGGYTWNDSFISKLLQNIEFTKFDNSVLPLTISSYNIDSMDDGTFGYGNYSVEAGLNDVNKTGINPNDYAQIVGSTYAVSVKIDDGNFELINNTFILKYKTVKLGVNGTVWYTIEDALNLTNNTETLFLAGQDVNNGFITTAFSNLSVEQGYPYNINSSEVYTYTLGSSRKLIVPYEEQINNETDPDKSVITSYGNFNIYSCLYISENIKLNLNANSKIVVDAELGYYQANKPNVTTTITKKRGVILNNGTINNSGEIYAYGYIKSSKYNLGNLYIENGGRTVDSFHTYDFPGGNTATSLKLALPMNAWNVHNISCKTIVKYGGIYDASFYAKPTAEAFVIFSIIKKSGNCLFIPQNSNSYIIKEATHAINSQNDSLTLVSGSNQERGQKDLVTVYGEWIDSTISISKSGFTMETSKTKACPISYMDVIIEKNATLHFKNASYVFLPGTNLKVVNGGILSVEKGVSLSFEAYNHLLDSSINKGQNFKHCCIDTFDAKMIVDGTFNCNGNIGGLITTNSENAVLNLNSATTNTTFYSMFNAVGASGNEADCSYKIDTYKAVGFFDSTTNVYGFNKNTYTSTFIDNRYVWFGDNTGMVSIFENNKIAKNGNLSTADPVSCIVEGTLVTLADGTKKRVEDITKDDKLLVFNHLTGNYEIGNILFINNHGNKASNHRILNLKFSDGTILRIVENHGLFDLDTLKYEYIDEYNYQKYIGHKFYKGTYDGCNYESSYAKLTNAYITEEKVRIYAIITASYMNSFTNDFISMPTIPYNSYGLVNIFEYNENLMYNPEQMRKDIEKYGLFTYEDFEHLMSYESFIASPAMYLKISLGKGYITENEIELIIKYLIDNKLIN